MRRVHLFEFEDQTWLPRLFRDYLTGLLHYQITRSRVYAPAARKLKDWMQKTNCTQIVDLCSGGGGPLIQIQEILEREEAFPVSVLLTDKFPNSRAIKAIRDSNNSIQYEDHPVDIKSIPSRLKGFRTLFTCFHHFDPDTAVRILQDAVDEMAPIAAFEFTRRRPSNIAGMLLSPIAVLFDTARVSPFRWGRLIWTYLLPVVPLMYWWDGTVSHLRTYTVAELQELVSRVNAASYEWEVGEIESGDGSDSITFLIGKPGSGSSANHTNRR